MALETIYDYFEDHTKAAAYVQETRPVVFGTICFALGGLSLFVAQATAQKLFLLTFSVSSLILAVLWEILAGFILAAALHLVLEFEGIKGSAVSLYILLGLADLIWAVAVPFVLIARMLFPESQWPASVIFFLVGLMGLGLKARSLKDNYHISTVRAWVTLGLPYMALLFAVLVMLSLTFWIMLLKLMRWSA